MTVFLQEQNLPVRVALEATADFHRAIAHWLLRHGFEVHLASSVASARVREVLFNSWDKHDRKDAQLSRVKHYCRFALPQQKVTFKK